eukprot:1528124-Heterocapsa_arctica.AAC.1
MVACGSYCQGPSLLVREKEKGPGPGPGPGPPTFSNMGSPFLQARAGRGEFAANAAPRRSGRPVGSEGPRKMATTKIAA